MTGGVPNGLVRLGFSEPSCFVELCNGVLAPSNCVMRQECLKFATLYVPLSLNQSMMKNRNYKLMFFVITFLL